MGRRAIVGTGLTLLLIVIAAYVDGGEEPVRPIEQEVTVPPSCYTQSSASSETSAAGEMTR